MKYFYEEPEEYVVIYGTVETVNHPMCFEATKFQIGDKGIFVVQQHFDKEMKMIRWGAIDPWLANDIYTHPDFYDFFCKNAKENIFPIIQVRALMWALRMKPLKRELWEKWKGDTIYGH